MEVHHPDVQVAATAANKFCQRWVYREGNETLLVLQGVSGCGKTHIAKRVVRWAPTVAKEPWVKARNSDSEFATARFLDWSTVCTPERLSDADWLSLLNEIARESLVVIDDIGCEVDRFKTGAHIERLCMILNRRAGKFTLITTNHPPELWAEVWDARVSDRLLRNSVVVTMKAPSYTTVN